jgi:hypothetical protein
MRTSRRPINMGEQLAVRPGNRQLEQGLGPPVALVVLENLVARVALAVLESRVAPAARVALAALEKPVVRAVQVALAVLENPVVPAALVRQLVVALVKQVGAAEKEAQTRSVAISRRRAAAAVLSLAGVGVLLKPRAAEVAVA